MEPFKPNDIVSFKLTPEQTDSFQGEIVASTPERTVIRYTDTESGKEIRRATATELVQLYSN